MCPSYVPPSVSPLCPSSVCLTRASCPAVVGEILEGKRTKKTVERLDFQAPKQMEKIKIGDGEDEGTADEHVCHLCRCWS